MKTRTIRTLRPSAPGSDLGRLTSAAKAACQALGLGEAKEGARY